MPHAQVYCVRLNFNTSKLVCSEQGVQTNLLYEDEPYSVSNSKGEQKIVQNNGSLKEPIVKD